MTQAHNEFLQCHHAAGEKDERGLFALLESAVRSATERKGGGWKEGMHMYALNSLLEGTNNNGSFRSSQ